MERPEIKQSLGDIGITEAHKIYRDSHKLFKHIQKLDNYIDYLEDELKNCLIADVMAMLPLLDVEELNELINKFNNTDQDLMDFIGSVWNKAYTLGCIDGSKSNYR